MHRPSNDNICHILEPILWDYNVEALDFYELLLGRQGSIGLLDQQHAIVRVLERCAWYDVLELLGIEFLKKYLTQMTIQKIRFPDMRKKYEIVREILQGDTVPTSGWSADTRQRARNAILSNRWYRTEPSLL